MCQHRSGSPSIQASASVCVEPALPELKKESRERETVSDRARDLLIKFAETSLDIL